MNNFKRKKMLSDTTRRKYNRRHPSSCRNYSVAWEEREERINSLHRTKYNRHSFNTPWWWTPDCLNDVAM
jgi:hypothetical protein